MLPFAGRCGGLFSDSPYGGRRSLVLLRTADRAMREPTPNPRLAAPADACSPTPSQNDRRKDEETRNYTSEHLLST
jgi:hypothetical protein